MNFWIVIGILLIAIGTFSIHKGTAIRSNETTKKLETKIDNLTNIVIRSHEQYMKEQYEIQQATGRLIPPVSGESGEPYKLIFGTNTFINTPNVLVVDGVPLVTMQVRGDELLVSATIYNDKGQVSALIRDNNWIFERSISLKKEVKINSIKVWDAKNNLLLDCQMLSNKTIKLNGIFRKGTSEIIATDEGLQVRSSGNGGVGLGGS